jgi:uncharacterized protein (TIGR00266 family)
MKFSIEQQPVFSVLRLILEAGEQIRAEAGAMISMSGTVELKAKASGKGVLGTLGAMMGGESLFAAEYTAGTSGDELILAPSYPGDILHLPLKNETIFAQSGAFLAGSTQLQLSSQGSLKALVSGEGLFLQKISGSGDLWLASYGAIIEKRLSAVDEYVVDTGNMVAFEASLTYSIKTASRGLFSSVASGEGLVCRFRGPGRLWIQTRSISALAQTLKPYFPSNSGS